MNKLSATSANIVGLFISLAAACMAVQGLFHLPQGRFEDDYYRVMFGCIVVLIVAIIFAAIFVRGLAQLSSSAFSGVIEKLCSSFFNILALCALLFVIFISTSGVIHYATGSQTIVSDGYAEVQNCFNFVGVAICAIITVASAFVISNLITTISAVWKSEETTVAVVAECHLMKKIKKVKRVRSTPYVDIVRPLLP